MTDVQDKPKRERRPKLPVGESGTAPPREDEGEAETYQADKPAVVPEFRRGDRVDYWEGIIDGNLEAFAADVLKVFKGINGQPTKYWVNVIWPGQLVNHQDVTAAAIPKHHTITARE